MKLEVDANIIDYETHSRITNRFNNNIINPYKLSDSNNEIKCCGMVINSENKYYNKNNYNNIFHFLNYLNLMSRSYNSSII